MLLLKLFWDELGDGKWRSFLVLAAISGGASAAVLAMINLASANAGDSDAMARALAILVGAIVLYAYSQRILMARAAAVAQSTVHRLRVQLLRTLRAAELEELERLNPNEISSVVNTEMRVISDGASALMIIAQSAVLTVVTMAYLAWLSIVAFVVAAAFIGVAASFHLSRNRQIIDQHERLFWQNTELIEGFQDLLDGFKEIKLNTARAEDLIETVGARSAAMANGTLGTQMLFAANFVASQVTFFLLTAIMIFVVPMFSAIAPPVLVKITATTLFLVGPISAVVGGLPTVQRINAAAGIVLALAERLSAIGLRAANGQARVESFERIRLEGATYKYGGKSEDGFTVGPIDLEIARGQVAFITGGNGSGKSTLLKLVTRLYAPTCGTITLDGAAVERDRIDGYRNLFSAIFSDNHLFKTFYGLPAVDPAKVAEYLRLMELEHKVTITDRGFDTVALSSGQRKRLAMIVTLLEDRPICVFDEWAADQDPIFRQKFYREILPGLRAANKTIIAVTHDERYFDAADTRYHMEEGQLRQVAGAIVVEAPKKARRRPKRTQDRKPAEEKPQ